MLGYAREEYVGQPIAKFHASAPVIGDILTRLTAGETLTDYPAQLRCKDGSLRDVLIYSSVYREDGKFIHTRCFTRDITEFKRAEAARYNRVCSFHRHPLPSPLPSRERGLICASRGLRTGFPAAPRMTAVLAAALGFDGLIPVERLFLNAASAFS